MNFLFLLLDKFSQNSYKLSASALFSGVCQAFSPDSFLWRLPEESEVTIHYGQSFLTYGEEQTGRTHLLTVFGMPDDSASKAF